ncbi:MAG: hypothetical protein V4808_05015 [Pseudomonadota bacterium]
MARYSEGGAFSFYKQPPPSVWPETASSQPARLDWSYPIDPRPSQIPAEPVRIDAIFAGEAERPVPETFAQPEPTYSAVVGDPPEPAAEDAAVEVVRGSWSQPQPREAPPSEAEADEPAKAAPAANMPPAAASPET